MDMSCIMKPLQLASAEQIFPQLAGVAAGPQSADGAEDEKHSQTPGRRCCESTQNPLPTST